MGRCANQFDAAFFWPDDRAAPMNTSRDEWWMLISGRQANATRSTFPHSRSSWRRSARS